MADRRFTPDLCATIDDILKKDGGSLSKYNACMTAFRNANIVESRRLHISQLAVHPKNRGGLGINPHNAHKTMLQIFSVGADRRLIKAVCFEMTPVGGVMESQLDFNRKLIESSEGLMSALTGAEKFLSVSCSHFTQACKAMVAGCRTPIVGLQKGLARSED